VLGVALLAAPGCLVLTVNPTHDRDALVWEPGLVGQWQSPDDNASLTIEKGEWQSYKIHYTHTIESGHVTGYLTTIGQAQYLDVMPARGEDRGAFLLPVHATVRIKLMGDKLELTALSYDWFFDRLRQKTPIPGLAASLDEKENALIVSTTTAVRAWLAKQPPGSAAFGASAVFIRKPGG
jgi:hypothetical protein